MTYCLGMLLDEGLILMSDTRTYAGVDNHSTYKKLHRLAEGPDRLIPDRLIPDRLIPDRLIYACTAGNLSVSQTGISMLREGLPQADGRDEARTLADAGTMFQAALLAGEAMHRATQAIEPALAGTGVSAGATTLLGGRIGDAPPALFLIYEAGNFIQCKPESPFFQIGETKYGRPILDRELRPATSLADAVKIGLLSFDAAMASNLGVARPIDLMVMPTDRARPILNHRIERDDAYFETLSEQWGAALSKAARSIPNPPFMNEPAMLRRVGVAQ